MNDILQLWSTRSSFDDEPVESLHSWIENIPCYRHGFRMHCINAMLSAFEYIYDHIKMLRAIVLNEVFQELADLERDPTTWKAQNGPDELISNRDDCLTARLEGFALDIYKDALETPKLISFRRWY